MEEALEEAEEKDDDRVLFNPEHHILLPNAQKIKKDAIVGDEIIFPPLALANKTVASAATSANPES